jgi:hypothetical protein
MEFFLVTRTCLGPRNQSVTNERSRERLVSWRRGDPLHQTRRICDGSAVKLLAARARLFIGGSRLKAFLRGFARDRQVAIVIGRER